ncbi:CapA family protein [Nakamurella sp. YIM 132087]|uniref:CapA family protein n=1 Tax=Nakamurella alba TaxID=2665158 RepID=A0A7K1FNS7_9ACTN|nr:CapA family protein [Nakamurella alba]MTD15796.1 CapA family protein [Nakamurella alba]
MTQRRRPWPAAVVALALLAAGCGSGAAGEAGPVVTVTERTTVVASVVVSGTSSTASDAVVATTRTPSSTRPTSSSRPPATSTAPPEGTFTLALAGDVNFSERTRDRLDDPATAFGVAAAGLARADLTMLNLETAITEAGEQQDKSYTFRAPASALDALWGAGVDVATMANNHAADYGASGLQDTLAAIGGSDLPVIGVGADAAAAYAPFETTVRGVPLSVFAVTAVREQTLANFTAGPDSAGVASAFEPELVAGVRKAAKAGRTVVVYLHWGTEYEACPDGDQQALANELAAAGASAVVGTHAHVLQGAGWRSDGVYVAYGLSNYLWWRSFGNEQDDNGVLTLSFTGRKVTAASFAPAHLDDAGIPVPATGATRERILQQWDDDRECAGLAAAPPR